MASLATAIAGDFAFIRPKKKYPKASPEVS